MVTRSHIITKLPDLFLLEMCIWELGIILTRSHVTSLARVVE